MSNHHLIILLLTIIRPQSICFSVEPNRTKYGNHLLGLFYFVDESSGKINNQVADCRLDNDGEGPEARTGLLHVITYIYIYI